MEKWKPILGYNGRYEVSDYGRVRSRALAEVRYITPVSNGTGYFQVRFSMKRKRVAVYLHRLVALYFVDGYADELEVDHIDNDKSNNRHENLRWVTRLENMRKCHDDNPHIMTDLNQGK